MIRRDGRKFATAGVGVEDLRRRFDEADVDATLLGDDDEGLA